MKFQQLRYLVAVHENGLNITAAARQLHTSQPGVSRQLKLLKLKPQSLKHHSTLKRQLMSRMLPKQKPTPPKLNTGIRTPLIPLEKVGFC